MKREARTFVELERVGYRYRRSASPALSDVSAAIARGIVLGLIGPNGSGKTTLFKLLLGLMRPSDGRARIAGLDPAVYRRGYGVGYLPEAVSLPPEVHALELAAYAASLAGLSSAAASAAIDRLLGELELADRAGDPIRSLSHGYRQRVGLLITLLGDPQLLLLDEPASGLDPTSIGVMRSQVRALKRRGVTIVISSHNLLELERVYDEVLLLRLGRVLGRSERADLDARPDVWVVQLPGDSDERQVAVALDAAGGISLAADEFAFDDEELARDFAAHLGGAELIERRRFDLEYLFHSLVRRSPEVGR